MMKVFIDTNVILEYFMHREEFELAKRLMLELRQQHCELVMSAGSFYTMIFLFDKQIRKEQELRGEERLSALRSVMLLILRTFTVAGQDNTILTEGIKDNMFRDLEDACQYQLAWKAGCHYLLTFNIDDYPANDSDLSVKVLSPKQYLMLQKH